MSDLITAVGELVLFVFASNYIKETVFLTFSVCQIVKEGHFSCSFFQTVQWSHRPLYYAALANDKTLFISFILEKV
jgi:hypothetical protein